MKLRRVEPITATPDGSGGFQNPVSTEAGTVQTRFIAVTEALHAIVLNEQLVQRLQNSNMFV